MTQHESEKQKLADTLNEEVAKKEEVSPLWKFSCFIITSS